MGEKSGSPLRLPALHSAIRNPHSAIGTFGFAVLKTNLKISPAGKAAALIVGWVERIEVLRFDGSPKIFNSPWSLINRIGKRNPTTALITTPGCFPWTLIQHIEQFRNHGFFKQCWVSHWNNGRGRRSRVRRMKKANSRSTGALPNLRVLRHGPRRGSACFNDDD